MKILKLDNYIVTLKAYILQTDILSSAEAYIDPEKLISRKVVLSIISLQFLFNSSFTLFSC